jgi:thioredoxin-related protein
MRKIAQNLKLVLGIILFFIYSSPAFSQEGVNFEHITFEEALAKAKASGKMVFIDCYTSWCGPCKKLSAEVFHQKIVGDYINERFVSVKYDVEKEEYKFIAKQFEVRAYPTMLIISSDGKLIDKVVGYQPAEKLVDAIEASFDKNKSLSGLKAKYESGDKDKITLIEYFAKLQSGNSPEAQEVGEKLYSALSDSEKQSKTFWYFFSNEKFTTYNTERFNYLKSNYAAFCSNIGSEKVNKVLLREWEKILKKSISLNPSITNEELKALKKEYLSLGFKNVKALDIPYAIAVICRKKSVSQIIKVAAKDTDFLGTNIQYWAVVTDIITKEGTKADKLEWVKVCEKIIDLPKEDYMKTVIKYTIDNFKK